MLSQLVKTQKLVRPDLLQLFAKLGYPLPIQTRKQDLVGFLSDSINKNKNDISLSKSGRETIISLDMGVKNLSMSKFSISNKDSKVPELQQWFKLDLDPTDLQFNPVNYSQITTKFLNNYIIDNNRNEHTSVLLERQRFRTAGSANVLDSTLKTNTIESMLCMGLTIHNNLNANDHIGIITSNPGIMVKFWQKECNLNNKMNDKESKLFRIEIVLNMLSTQLISNNLLDFNKITNNSNDSKFPISFTDNDKFFKLSDDIKSKIKENLKNSIWCKSWYNAWSFKSKSRKLWEICKILNQLDDVKYKIDDPLWGKVKGDDLADSLLHGIAHCEYLKNRLRFQEIVDKQSDIKSFLKIK